ncbi:DUF2842 domain-containing protein [Asticcacaulis sp. EMRT-3]|uniref:DUF2842 domain-containing protein n=1 Tax=Asticcacaulis sp. EMRT-3 TaxID=3040349 RepID=UPI0024AED60C|nr:DUF2842 domain-containing protein [Asticcacaulis sp. EMRT-3]MDI7774860.1 DUF2842 domain-containing protein [Asticcacaulis sp. EMRT-3]
MQDSHSPKGLSLPKRRLIACLGILVFLPVYVVVAASLAAFIHGGPITAFIFYALAGTLWGVPLIPLISWSENYRKRRK